MPMAIQVYHRLLCSELHCNQTRGRHLLCVGLGDCPRCWALAQTDVAILSLPTRVSSTLITAGVAERALESSRFTK